MTTTTLDWLHWQNSFSLKGGLSHLPNFLPLLWAWNYQQNHGACVSPHSVSGICRIRWKGWHLYALLLSNLRNVCGVWHAMGYSGRCGHDVIYILRNLKRDVREMSHLNPLEGISVWHLDDAGLPGRAVCFRWHGGSRRLFACGSLGMPRDHGSLLQWVWPWF